MTIALLVACAEAPPETPGEPAPADDPWEVGDEVPDLELPSQHGKPVGLRDFDGDVVVVFVTTGWMLCSGGSMGPDCELLQAFADERAPEGFSWVTVLQQDYEGNAPTPEFAAYWADAYGFSGPVLADELGQTADAVPERVYPVVYVVGRDGSIVARDVPAEVDSLAAEVDPLL